jgi:hypothetical protein
MWGWIAGAAADIAKGIVNKFLPASMTDEEKLAAEIEIEQLLTARDTKLLEAQTEIITAELEQDDSYTKRVRPTIGYVLIALLVLYVLRLLFSETPPPELPVWMREVFLGYFGVYFVGRSWEKVAQRNGKGDKPRLMRILTGK